MRKYSILEVLFSNRWQWARKLSDCFWVKQLPDGMWVKFSDKEVRELVSVGVKWQSFDEPGYLVEDYRSAPKGDGE